MLRCLLYVVGTSYVNSDNTVCTFYITIGGTKVVEASTRMEADNQPLPASRMFYFAQGDLGTPGTKTVSITTGCRQTNNVDYITLQAFQFNKV